MGFVILLIWTLAPHSRRDSGGRYRASIKPFSDTHFWYLSNVTQYVIWLYLYFNLSRPDVVDLLAERGIDVSYEYVRM